MARCRWSRMFGDYRKEAVSVRQLSLTQRIQDLGTKSHCQSCVHSSLVELDQMNLDVIFALTPSPGLEGAEINIGSLQKETV
jgi:hypothetical protein